MLSLLVKWNNTSSPCPVAFADSISWPHTRTDLGYELLATVMTCSCMFSQYSIFCKHVCLLYWATDRKLDLQAFLYFISMRIYTWSTRPHYMMVLHSMAVFVTFRQHGPRLNLDTDRIGFEGLHSKDQFE